MSDLVEIALIAFRCARYVEAVDMFEQSLVYKPDDWIARLYLGMAYRKLDRVGDAWRNFEMIVRECTDADVVERAAHMLQQLKDEFTDVVRKRKSEISPDKRDEAVGGN